MPEEPKPPTPILGGTPAIVSASVEGAERLSRFSPLQVIIVLSLLSMIVGMGLTVYLVINVIADKAASETRWQLHADSLGRANDEQREADRKHFFLLDSNRSRDVDARLKMVLDHCSAREDKAREADNLRWERTNKLLLQVATELAKKKPLDPELQQPLPMPFLGPIPNVMPAIAPLPREKSALLIDG